MGQQNRRRESQQRRAEDQRPEAENFCVRGSGLVGAAVLQGNLLEVGAGSGGDVRAVPEPQLRNPESAQRPAAVLVRGDAEKPEKPDFLGGVSENFLEGRLGNNFEAKSFEAVLRGFPQKNAEGEGPRKNRGAPKFAGGGFCQSG